MHRLLLTLITTINITLLGTLPQIVYCSEPSNVNRSPNTVPDYVTSEKHQLLTTDVIDYPIKELWDQPFVNFYGRAGRIVTSCGPLIGGAAWFASSADKYCDHWLNDDRKSKGWDKARCIGYSSLAGVCSLAGGVCTIGGLRADWAGGHPVRRFRTNINDSDNHNATNNLAKYPWNDAGFIENDMLDGAFVFYGNHQSLSMHNDMGLMGQLGQHIIDSNCASLCVGWDNYHGDAIELFATQGLSNKGMNVMFNSQCHKHLAGVAGNNA